MGKVYRAKNVTLERVVALKTLSSLLSSDQAFVQRFLKEARVAARLNHPNIVQIYDFGCVEDTHYIAMEFVDGQSLRRQLALGRFTEHDALIVARQAVRGLAVAHTQGIVHRDIKPDNIMILPPDVDDGHERVKVVDFGIAKLKDMVAAKTLTQSGRMIGTVYYMSPEQCAAEHLDSRSDVYSLGAVLYELLSGSPPFTAETASGIIAKHLTQPPPPLPTELGVSAEVEAVITRALSKEASGRQNDAAAFRAELQLACGDSPSRRTAENLGSSATLDQPQAAPNSSQSLLPATRVSADTTSVVAPTADLTHDKPSHRGRWIVASLVLVLSLAVIAVFPGRALLRRFRKTSEVVQGPTKNGWQVSHTLATKSRVYALAFSPDDQVLVTASSEGLRQDRDFISELHFWNASTGELQRSIVEHSEGMLSLAFSPDGRMLATGLGSGNASGKIGKVKLWDTQTGILKWAVNGHSDFATSVAFSPDGKTIASASFDKTVKLWDAETGQLRLNLPQQSKVYAIAFSPSGDLLAVASQNSVELRSLNSNELRQSLANDSIAATAVTFSKDGKLIAGSDVSGKVTLWDAETGVVKNVMSEHTDVVDSLAFSPDGKILATGGYDASVILWDTQSNSVVSKLTDPDKVTSLAFSHDGRILASGGWSKSVRLWSK